MQLVSRYFFVLACFSIFATASTSSVAETVFDDPDFVEESVSRPDGSGWSEVVGLVFADDGSRGYAWERGGRVWVLDDADPVTSPLIDISEEVLGWRDYGLLGFALDPNFVSNGHIYLYYVVDRHHLEHCAEPTSGTGAPECDAGYSDNTTIKATRAVIGRITRYTALMPAGDTDFSDAVSVDYNSRKVLVGETPQTGFPILHQSHGTGNLLFGTDGTLLAACGDGASYSTTDVGSVGHTGYAEGLADGIIKSKENVGAFRSQLLDSLNGKIIRIDPATGDGIASNPFYDSANPRSPTSRVWSLGLRNPYRMGLKPNTGSHDPADANPGTVYIGDVGWGTWEDWHVADAPGLNFGWPAFEGHTVHNGYWNNAPVNQDAADALGCSVTFTDLIKQDTLGSAALPNPCGGGNITTFPTFVHERPKLDWRHGQDIARYPAFDSGGNPVAVTVGQPVPGTSNVLVQGSPFRGNAATGGVIYTGDDFPGDYANTYFMADYGSQWIKNVIIDDNDNAAVVRPFISNAGGVVFLATHPIQGELYYISWATDLRRVSYAPGGNRPPDAVASASATFGASPLTVNFTGDQSSDPEGTALSYEWDFGDGTALNTAANPQHTFNAPDSNPVSYTVTLAVTDAGSPPGNDVDQILVSVNNTPPDVAITSPPDGTLYPITGDTLYDLTATISDAEHAPGELTCAWQTVLHHNEHTHADPVDYNCATQTQIAPLGCGAETYFFRIHLTVTDGAGLSTSAVSTLLPDCPNNNPPTANADAAAVEAFGSVDIAVAANDSDDVALDLGSIEIVNQPAAGIVTVQPGNGVVTYESTSAAAATDAFSYTIRDSQGAVSNVAQVSITISNTVATPVMSPGGGTFGSPVFVSIGTTTTGSTIYYTQDGTDPDEGSAAFVPGSPILIDSDSTLKARAYKAGLNPSAIASADYTVFEGLFNIASLAAVSASSEYSAAYAAANAVDGVANGDPFVSGVEWASRREKAGAWLDLDWGSNTFEVGQVVIYDRPNDVDQVLSGTLTFSDGSTVAVGVLPNGGEAVTLDFAPRSTTSLRFTVDSVLATTKNTGISEIEVYGQAGVIAPVANDDSASVFEGQSVVIPILDNDSADAGLDPASVAIVSVPLEGNIAAINAATGEITYTHLGGTATADSFTYTVLDTNGEISNEATVSLSIGPYVPPTVTIVSPAEAELVTAPTVSVDFQRSGDSTAYDHVHVSLDSDPYTAIHDLSVTSFDFGVVAPGSHSISVWLVSADHQALGNPEASDLVTFDVAVGTPVISEAPGVYTAPILVGLSTTTAGAIIYYTLDGVDPDETSFAYTGSPILIDTNTTLKARAFLDNATPSAIASADYVFQDSLLNIAPLAVVTASSEYSASYAAANAVDGVASGDPFASGVEWASRREKAGAWLNLDWGVISYDINQIVLYDRPNDLDQVLSGTLTFSDGSTVTVGALSNDGAPVTVDFATPRTTTSLRFTVDSVSGTTKNSGLSEIEVYGQAGVIAPVANDDSASVFEGQSVVIPILDNDSADAGLDPASVAIVSVPLEGNIAAINAATGEITYTHLGGTATADSFTYTVLDTNGEISNEATVSLSIGPYVPPTVTIVSPAEAELVTAPTVSVDFQRSGDSTAYDHVHVSLDSDPYTAIHDLSVTSFDFGVVAPGSHSISVWLVSADHQALGNPEASDLVTFDVAVGTPVISEAPGVYTAPILVGLSTTTAGAIIYYTLDGVDPDETSFAYTGSPILIDTNTTLKARAFLDNATPSAIASADYVFQDSLLNIAPLAVVTASSEYSASYAAANAVDGVASGDPFASGVEWASRREKAGAWLNLDWGGISYDINQIVLYDRPNDLDQVLSGTLTFSDGSTVTVGALSNDGAPVTVDFATPRTTTSLRFTVDSVSGTTKNIGLSEIEVNGGLAGPQAPSANAGSDQSVTDGNGDGVEIAVLDGSGSADTDGVILDYRWSEGTTVLAQGPLASVSVDLAVGTHTIDLEVTDNDGLTAVDTVVITVEPQPANTAPNVDAGADTSVTVGDQLHLDGATVSDDGLPNPPATVSVFWTLVDGPATPTWPLGDQDNSHTHIVFPEVGTYVLRLTADDGELTAFDEISVNVSGDVAIPVMTPGAGTYGSPVFVSLSSDTLDSTIYYTTDGSDPSDGGSAPEFVPGNPIFIDTSSTLKARAYKAGLNPSAIQSADYFIQTGLMNIAPLATSVTASSQYSSSYAPQNAVDGVANGDPFASGVEWASRREKAGAWLDIDWGGISYIVSQIVLYDRPNTIDQVTSATVTFSDGTSVSVGMLPNDGAALTIEFAPRTITGLRFTTDSVSTSTRNTGLAEIEVFGGL